MLRYDISAVVAAESVMTMMLMFQTKKKFGAGGNPNCYQSGLFAIYFVQIISTILMYFYFRE